MSSTPNAKLQTPNSFTLPAPAKINLDLRVGPPRSDGFHPIRSWFVTVDLCDTLDFAPADELSLACDDPLVPADANNLVWRAAQALRPADGRGVAIRLTKRIPAAAGLGGGSSDAAATLLALNAFWRLGLSVDRLHAVAVTLGSDVPFFLHGPSAVCTGRGEVVTPVPPPPCAAAVLVLPPIALSTPAVFRRLDALRPTAVLPDVVRTAPTNTQDLLRHLTNDLEWPAFDLRPDLATLRRDVETRLGRPVRMSGSGSALFTLYDDWAGAVAARDEVRRNTTVRCVAVRVALGVR